MVGNRLGSWQKVERSHCFTHKLQYIRWCLVAVVGGCVKVSPGTRVGLPLYGTGALSKSCGSKSFPFSSGVAWRNMALTARISFCRAEKQTFKDPRHWGSHHSYHVIHFIPIAVHKPKMKQPNKCIIIIYVRTSFVCDKMYPPLTPWYSFCAFWAHRHLTQKTIITSLKTIPDFWGAGILMPVKLWAHPMWTCSPRCC